jgi:hypothetical protein
MTRKTRILLFLVGSMVAPAAALAGYKTSPEVTITTSSTSTFVRGSLVGAHNSADSVQYIGCQIRGDFAYCWARNAAGHTAMCSTSDAGKMAAMRTTNAASYLNITITNGSCTSLEVTTASQYMSPIRNIVAQP